MTDAELWVKAQQDYLIALRGANKAWAEAGLTVSNDALQAGAATLLIHLTKLRERGGVTPQPAAAAATRGGGSTASAAVGVPRAVGGATPPCPACGGVMKDARAEKRSDKSPDFVCLQQHGTCVKAGAKGKMYPTATWAEKGPALAMATSIRQQVDEGYDKMPRALQGGAAEDDLPF